MHTEQFVQLIRHSASRVRICHGDSASLDEMKLVKYGPVNGTLTPCLLSKHKISDAPRPNKLLK